MTDTKLSRLKRIPLVGKHKDIRLIVCGVLVTGGDAEVTDRVRALTWHTNA